MRLLVRKNLHDSYEGFYMHQMSYRDLFVIFNDENGIKIFYQSCTVEFCGKALNIDFE